MSSTISQIKVTIGNAQSTGFTIPLDQVQYRLSDFVLNQSMLAPNSLMFSMHKVSAETIQDTQFYVCGQIIGQKITVSVDLATVMPNFQKKTDETYNANLYFEGIIVSANGVRGENAEYSIQVQAMGWESLMDSNPDCRSFTDKTLKDIVYEVLHMAPSQANRPSFSVDPWFQEKIPYCVMYNETHYQFLQRLASRYGEWLYNDGRSFIFGQLPANRLFISLKYPSQDVPYYQVNLQIQSFRNKNVSQTYIGNDSGTVNGPQENDLFPPGRGSNGLLSGTYQASRNCYSDVPRFRNLHSGGFSDLGYWPNDSTVDGKTVSDIATRSQRFGEKSSLVTYSGKSLCAFVQVGATLGIVDNYLIGGNASNQTSPVNQHPALITTVTHSFSDNNTYYNCFTGIPNECSCPPYSDPDIYPQCPPCRAWVTDNEDPLGLGRVRVQFGWQKILNPACMTPFIRIAQPYAGGGKGFSFIPEVHEEVMVDFEGGNAERPYVRGALYNGGYLPEQQWVANHNQGNRVKAIRTQNGHTIEFHDEGNVGFIRIYDNANQNYDILFSSDRKLIRLVSTGNIELCAGRDIILEAKENVSIKSCQDTILSAQGNHTRYAKLDLTDHVDGNRSAYVAKNDSEHVDGSQKIVVEDSKDEEVKDKLQTNANTIRIEAQNKLMEYSSVHEQKANAKMSLDGGPMIEIKGSIAKIN
jgi:uncharacterized protein involved in type VI secretion and phage assembly